MALVSDAALASPANSARHHHDHSPPVRHLHWCLLVFVLPCDRTADCHDGRPPGFRRMHIAEALPASVSSESTEAQDAAVRCAAISRAGAIAVEDGYAPAEFILFCQNRFLCPNSLRKGCTTGNRATEKEGRPANCPAPASKRASC